MQKLQQNKELISSIKNAATENEIAQTANEFDCKFTGDELKAISKENIPEVKVKEQDTSPSNSIKERGNQKFLWQRRKIKKIKLNEEFKSWEHLQGEQNIINSCIKCIKYCFVHFFVRFDNRLFTKIRDS